VALVALLAQQLVALVALLAQQLVAMVALAALLAQELEVVEGHHSKVFGFEVEAKALELQVLAQLLQKLLMLLSQETKPHHHWSKAEEVEQVLLEEPFTMPSNMWTRD
jgi:hypothetical protein